MQLRAGVTVVAALAVVVSALAVPVAAAPTVERPAGPVVGSEQTGGVPANHSAPADPEIDVLGWEAGYWYNETLHITEEDGLNQSELEAVVARSMARVEQLRDLEFNRSVPVEVISREAYREQYVDSNTTETLRTFDNVKFEALFLIGEDRDSLAVQEANRGSNVLGFYSPSDDRIVIVSETETPRVTETTLGHELVHALQFGQFNMSAFNSSTRELHNARNGVIEGDASYVDRLYGEKCGTEWNCTTQASSGGGGGGDLHLGVYIMKFFPYSDGPGFVEYIRQEGDWEAVNDLYTAPPRSAEQVIIPAQYREDAPADVSLPDRSNEEWSRVTPSGRAPYGSVGQPSIAAMFAYPAYDDSRNAGPVVAPRQFLNVDPDGSVNSSDPINYNFDYANGWAGDKLWVYQNDENQTAYTWRIVWDTETEAAEFAQGYRSLLRYWGGEPVDGHDGVWRISEGESGFADAFHLQVEGDAVTIVNAPTVEALDEVQDGTLATPTPTRTSTPTATRSPSPSASPTGTPGQPGFGFGLGLAGLAAGLLWWRRRP